MKRMLLSFNQQRKIIQSCLHQGLFVSLLSYPAPSRSFIATLCTVLSCAQFIQELYFTFPVLSYQTAVLHHWCAAEKAWRRSDFAGHYTRYCRWGSWKNGRKVSDLSSPKENEETIRKRGDDGDAVSEVVCGSNKGPVEWVWFKVFILRLLMCCVVAAVKWAHLLNSVPICHHVAVVLKRGFGWWRGIGNFLNRISWFSLLPCFSFLWNKHSSSDDLVETVFLSVN